MGSDLIDTLDDLDDENEDDGLLPGEEPDKASKIKRIKGTLPLLIFSIGGLNDEHKVDEVIWNASLFLIRILYQDSIMFLNTLSQSQGEFNACYLNL